MYSTVEFANRYKELEVWANRRYGKDCLKFLEISPFDYRTRSELFYFKSVRNLVTHSPNGKNTDEDTFVNLTDEFEERFERLCHYLMMSVKSECIPLREIYTCVMKDKVLPTMSLMKDKNYTNVPIMNGKNVWGVFCDSTIFNLVGEENSISIDENTEFFDIRQYITDYSKDGIFDFASSAATIDDVCRMFSDALSHGRRLDVIFITTTGNKKGDLVGLITVWDIAKFLQ